MVSLRRPGDRFAFFGVFLVLVVVVVDLHANHIQAVQLVQYLEPGDSVSKSRHATLSSIRGQRGGKTYSMWNFPSDRGFNSGSNGSASSGFMAMNSPFIKHQHNLHEYRDFGDLPCNNSPHASSISREGGPKYWGSSGSMTL